MNFILRIALAATSLLAGHAVAHAQASLSEASFRPFVVGVVPVVGRGGAVGGVAVDAQGAIELAEQRDAPSLRAARGAALAGLAGDVSRPSKLRKISLRRLDALLVAHATQNRPLPPEVLRLAGLQRIEYLFAYPKERDVILAGPAHAPAVDDPGGVIGETTSAAVLQLVDLIAALRSTDRLLAGEPISCSIDPTPAGLQRLARLTRGARPSHQLLPQMEAAVGPQTITLTGIAPDSRFARVLVAADWHMKRLAMGLASYPSPSQGEARGGMKSSPAPERREVAFRGQARNVLLPSYLDLLKANPRVSPRNAMPRWWIAYGRKPVERDAEGLAWRLSPPGVEVRTAARRLDAGRLAADAPSAPLAQEWADAMTARYDELSQVEPAFSELRGCMDLALVTAVLASGDLLARVGLELPMLFDADRLRLAPHPVPKTVASQATALRRTGEWIVTVSGGVELDVAAAVNDAAVRAELRAAQTQAAPAAANSWWWD